MNLARTQGLVPLLSSMGTLVTTGSQSRDERLQQRREPDPYWIVGADKDININISLRYSKCRCVGHYPIYIFGIFGVEQLLWICCSPEMLRATATSHANHELKELINCGEELLTFTQNMIESIKGEGYGIIADL